MSQIDTAPKKSNMRRNIFIILGVLVLACVICGIVAAVAGGSLFNAVAAPLTTANSFMTALEAKDYPKAYGFIHPEQQAGFGGSADGMQAKLTDQGLAEPSTFTLTNINVTGDAIASGTASYNGTSKKVRIDLRKSGNDWKVIGYGFDQ